MKALNSISFVASAVLLVGIGSANAQDMLPADNGIATYHTQPRYRESESHPIRILAYIVHPVGWLLREGITRPLSYLASSTETTRSVFGYREPYDFRTPECFSADESAPDCRAVAPFNYEGPSSTLGTSMVPGSEEGSAAALSSERQVYFPDVNFDFDKRKLSTLGKGQTKRISEALKASGPVHIVLQGHTDFIGSDKYNEKLGMDRAEAVRAELVSLGVSGDRLSTVTFGKTQPIFPDQTDWARAVNRRVEVHLGDK